MDKTAVISEEHMDYLKEMMNIAAGNAATALSQLLNCGVDLKIPEIFVFPADKVSSIFKDPYMPTISVKTKLVGDVRGAIIFIITDEEKRDLLKLLYLALPPAVRGNIPVDSTAIEEIANIISGVFLAAVHDFSTLNIFHTVPVMGINIVHSLLEDELNSTKSDEQTLMVVETVLIANDGNVKAVLYMIPLMGSLENLVSSIEHAKKKLGIW